MATVGEVWITDPVPSYHQDVREGVQTPSAQIREIIFLATHFLRGRDREGRTQCTKGQAER